MRRTRTQILRWEGRWATPVAIVTFLAVAMLIASNVANQVSGEGSAAILRSTHEHSGSVALTGALQAAGFLLLAAPIFYLFRAARARSERVRAQLVGLVIAAPIFLALSAGLTIGVRNEAASQFVAGEAKSTLTPKEAAEECKSDLKEEGAKAFGEKYDEGPTPAKACEERKVADQEAENASTEAGLAPLVSGFGLAGGLGFAVILVYTGLWAMRTGLMTRFWGSLGMASGIAFLLGPLFLVTLAWFIYLGCLLLGWVPGGRPPAWAAGEAVEWPTPGQKIAAQMEPSDPDAIDVDAVEEEGTAGAPGNENGNGSLGGGPAPRKRKRRDS